MATLSSGTKITYGNINGTGSSKSIGDMSEQEFADYAANAQRNQSRNSQISSMNNASLQQQAKDMAQVQLENADKQMAQSAKYRSAEKTQDDSIARGQSEQQYGFQRGLADQSYNNQRGLADQNYGFQRGLNDQQNTQQSKMQDNQYGQERTMFNMQDSARQRDTQSARQAANALYFGRSRGRQGFQGRG